MRRVFIVSGLLSMVWDLFSFVVPIHGSTIHLSASTIGTYSRRLRRRGIRGATGDAANRQSRERMADVDWRNDIDRHCAVYFPIGEDRGGSHRARFFFWALGSVAHSP
jgi:hypothetical protein